MKKFLSISLFFVYSISLLYFGFISGKISESNRINSQSESHEELKEDGLKNPDTEAASDENKLFEVAAISKEVLDVNTQYIVETYNHVDGSCSSMVQKVPEKYLGMDRNEFLKAMDIYEKYPPLSEQEKGFTNLEVTKFSAQKTIIKMYYSYKEPSKGFYLCIVDHHVKVFCDDKTTVYLETELMADDFPEYLRVEMLQGLYMETEEQLYHFLETYSS